MTGTGTARPAGCETLIDFMARFAESDQFNKVFQEGMSLVEETANYLDGQGRNDARGLDRHASIAYATESMRLTTRLMQLASWLLLQRAVSSGELSEESAVAEKHRINLDDVGPGAELVGAEQLPEGLKDLLERSLRLRERVIMFDRMIGERREWSGKASNPVAGHLDRLQQVFPTASARAE